MTRIEQGFNRWAIVLAGGEGERLRPFVERCFGAARPKQYCAFTGGRTMLEHTWARALQAVPESRLVTVIGRGHRAYLPEASGLPGRIIEQPARKDTGPGVFLPLTYVMAEDPAAVVAVFPSDHFISPDDAFQHRLEEAFSLAEVLPGHAILLAAEPERAEPDYGWILTGSSLPGFRRAHGVKAFREKPKPEEAERLRGQGALCNTMIVVARAGALWDLGWGLEPGLMSRFQALKPWIGSESESRVLAGVFEDMESSNFSRDILEKAADRAVALRMEGVSWCDWGRPERILETLENIVSSTPPLWPRPTARPSIASATA